jgi:acetyl esterase/lipase
MRIAPAAAIVLAALAAGAAALIVAPAPSKSLALLAIAVSEKSALVVAAGALALALAVAALLASPPPLLASSPPAPGWGARAWPAAVAVALAAAAVVVALIPLVQAGRLAAERQVRLKLGRYLAAPIDTEGPGRPQKVVEYAEVDGRRLVLDVYTPAARAGAQPARPVLVVHGGFWSAGQNGEAALFSRWLADRGFTVFDVQYRTSPQPNWQTATGDVKCAIGWIKRHPATSDWNVDPAKLVLLGRSAGGHLALMAAYTAGDAQLPPSCEAGDTTVDAVVALYAPTDLVSAYAHPANLRAADSPAKLRAFLGGTPASAGDRYRALSPAERVTAQAPRTMLVHGGRDQLVRAAQMQILADRLRAARVPCEALFIPYAQHAFDFVVGGFSGQIMEAVLLRFLGEANGAKNGAKNDG